MPALRIIALVVVVGFTGWVFFRALKRSDDPAKLVFKWMLTAGVLLVMIQKIAPMVQQGGYSAAFGGIPGTAFCGLILAAIWRRNIAGLIADPIGSFYDGGDTPPEPKPFYSHAMAKRKRGRYAEAIAEIWKQLEKFPNDYEGQMMLAEIQAADLKDLPAAEVTIQRLCNQSGHSPANVAMALSWVADCHLKYTRDREAARQAFEKIQALFPDTEMSAMAAQRIAHLGETAHLLSADDRRRFAVVEGVRNLGLLDPELHPRPADPGAAEQAGELVKHLHSHPLDTEAREKLALIYAEHYQRLDLAADQLEQMIADPNQPVKRVVHWLNLLADLQVRASCDYETVRQTVQRIVERFPEHSGAQLAQNRLALLPREMKAKQKSQAVKLGSYEQDIGLKMGSKRPNG